MAFVGLGIFLIALLTWRVTRSVLHPGVSFPAVWAFTLILIEVAQPFGYFPVHLPALVLFLTGSLFFSVGAWLGGRVARCEQPFPLTNPLPISLNLVVAFSWLLHALILPLWWQEVYAITEGAEDMFAFAYQLRIKSVYDAVTVGSLVGNYLVVGLILTPVLAIGVLRKQISFKTVALVCLPWVVTNLLTNGRAALVQLTLVLLYLRLLHNPGLPVLAIVKLLLLLTLLFGAGAVLVGKGGIASSSDLGDIPELIMLNLFDYALQGPILFSAYFENPHLINPTWDPFRVICSALQSPSWCEVGQLHQDFLYFGVGDRVGNVYSIFFSLFPSYGLAGTLGLLSAYGAWSAFHHRRATQGRSLFHILAAAHLFSAAVLSIFLDGFLAQLNFFVKVAFVCWLLPRVFVPTSRGTPAGQQAQ
ncbi:oligosaccharide repeat unit polymerase [Inhella inkyongensis]|uniref:Oligosaccharide repeat unit polymerase n=1 Tax=Inhella inkyongensis TaxID=392593 RepID=A0A840S4I7_9BURK|nr:O-antigen polymerase [Inhella inkyongensis]MBB5204472.1 oligosaccharide repeat unit polymerase [Inhella inkyongensis]